jgi:hypothetical protein
MLACPNAGADPDDSLDELSPIDVRSGHLPAVELLTGQMVAGFEGDGRIGPCGHGHLDVNSAGAPRPEAPTN